MAHPILLPECLNRESAKGVGTVFHFYRESIDAGAKLYAGVFKPGVLEK